jgi:PAS domain S-box-containing protein
MTHHDDSTADIKGPDSHRSPKRRGKQAALAEEVIATLPIALFIVDEDLNIVLANPAFCHLRGLPKENLAGTSMSNVLPSGAEDNGDLCAAVTSTLQTGECIQWFGYRYTATDQSDRMMDIHIAPVSAPHGKRHALLTLEDVSEERRQLYELSVLQQVAQAMLGMLELRRLLHAILTGMTAGGAIGLGFNRAFLMLVHRESDLLKTEMAVGPADAEEAADIWADLAIHQQTMDDLLAGYDAQSATERSQFFGVVGDLEIPLQDNTMLPVSVLDQRTTAHVVDGAGDPRVPEDFLRLLGANEFVVAPLLANHRRIGIIYADNSITGRLISRSDVLLFTSLANLAAIAIDRAAAYEEVHQHADEVEQAYEQLQAAQERSLRAERLAGIGEMTAVVAHEIRNPLSTIGGFVNLMLRQADDPQRIQRNAKIARDEVLRLEKILDGLLTLSQPARPRLDWHDISQTIADAVETVEQAPDTPDIEINVECEPDLPHLRIDCDQIRQVLDNLIHNAIDAMPQGGKVTISVQLGEDGEVILKVSDTGSGIAPSHLQRIFDTFFTTKSSGMGLGLALTRKIIHDHGAEVHVESEPNQGTTFTIIFPPDYETLQKSDAVSDDNGDNATTKGE